jgi:hypothetical protein
MSPRARFAFAWYFHLPAIATEVEVRDHIRGSLEPLMRLHREARRPYLLAPTGSFLRHCLAVSPETVATMRDELVAGRMSLAGTYLYETDPLSIPWIILGAQVGEDLALKEALLGERPRWFFLPNFVWRAGFERLLAAQGIEGILTDSRQLAASSRARSWRWETTAEGPVHVGAVEVPTADWEHRRIGLLRGPTARLRVAFRDWTVTRRLSFGNDGAIHRTDAEAEVASALKDIEDCIEPDDLIVIADDGDRIRGTSLPGYRSLLRETGGAVDWRSLLTERPATPPLRELPSYTPPGMATVLRESEDAKFYWSLLEEARSFDWSAAERRDLLALDDVFYSYWPGVARRQWYVEQALDRIELGARRSGLTEEPRGDPEHPTADREPWHV